MSTDDLRNSDGTQWTYGAYPFPADRLPHERPYLIDADGNRTQTALPGVAEAAEERLPHYTSKADWKPMIGDEWTRSHLCRKLEEMLQTLRNGREPTTADVHWFQGHGRAAEMEAVEGTRYESWALRLSGQIWELLGDIDAARADWILAMQRGDARNGAAAGAAGDLILAGVADPFSAAGM